MTLDGSNSSASGWVFFSIKNKWIGPWRRPEQFVLRLPVENLVVEIPFKLPPEQGKVVLRQRPEDRNH
jgi:DNA-directed RNA polymerase specialized sigma24 family protein